MRVREGGGAWDGAEKRKESVIEMSIKLTKSDN